MNKFWILYYLSIIVSLAIIGSLGQYIFGSGYAGSINYTVIALGFGAVVVVACIAVYLRFKAVAQDEMVHIEEIKRQK